MTRKQLILKLLIATRLNDARPDIKGWLLHDDSDPQRRVWISGGFRPLYFFRGPELGGDAADVRLRELKRDPELYEDGHGVPIEMRIHRWEFWRPEKKKVIRRTTPIYRLAMIPDEIRAYNWDPAWELPFTWKFQPIVPPWRDGNGRAPVTIQESKEGQLTFV